MHGVLRQERDIRQPHPVQTEGFMETNRVLERNQMFHQPPADLPVIETPAVDAEGLGNHLEALRRRIVVERHHVLDQHRIAQAMGQVEKTAEAVGHGMYRAENRIGKRQAGLHAA